MAYEDNKIPRFALIYGIHNTKETKTVFGMPIQNDSDALPVGSVIRIKRTNEFAIVKQKTFQKDGKGFLNYLVEIEGKQGLYCAFHDDVDLEH